MIDNNVKGCSASDCAGCQENCGSNGNAAPGEMTLTATMEDGSTLEFLVLCTFEAGENIYLALLPKERDASEAPEVCLYRYLDEAHGGPNAADIESDEEYQMAAEAFMELQQRAEEYRETLS